MPRHSLRQSLLLAGLLACGLVGASAAQPKPTFEVTSVKRYSAGQRGLAGPRLGPALPNGFYRAADTVELLVQFAYNIRTFQVIGGPDWIRSDRFEVNARAAGAVPLEQLRLMVQSLLEDRFKLVVRTDQREMRVETLGLARSDGRLGPKLEKCQDPANLPAPQPLRIPPGGVPFTGRCRELSAIAALASGIVRAPVLDKTGLTGLWGYEFVYAQNQPLPPGNQRNLADQENVPSFSTALQDELGLKLESGRGSVDVVVIESVQRPTEN